jgi:hypothetical protein
MEAFILSLPKSWQPKAKSLVTLLGVVLAGVVVAVPALPEWAILPVAILTFILTYQTPAPGYVAPSDQTDPPPDQPDPPSDQSDQSTT